MMPPDTSQTVQLPSGTAVTEGGENRMDWHLLRDTPCYIGGWMGCDNSGLNYNGSRDDFWMHWMVCGCDSGGC